MQRSETLMARRKRSLENLAFYRAIADRSVMTHNLRTAGGVMKRRTVLRDL
jgi:hypothetical protein